MYGWMLALLSLGRSAEHNPHTLTPPTPPNKTGREAPVAQAAGGLGPRGRGAAGAVRFSLFLLMFGWGGGDLLVVCWWVSSSLSLSRALRCDPTTHPTISPQPPPPPPPNPHKPNREFHCACFFSGQMFIFGGSTGTRRMNDTWRYKLELEPPSLQILAAHAVLQQVRAWTCGHAGVCGCGCGCDM